MGSHERRFGRLNPAFGSSHSASSAYQKWPTRHSDPSSDFKNSSMSGLSPVQSLRVGPGPSDPGSSNQSLYQMRLLHPPSASYPEGNFGGNQLLDSSFGLSPLYPALTIDLHVRTAADLHRVFPGFVLARHRSPSFGSQRVRSRCALVLRRTRHAPRMRLLAAGPPTRGGIDGPAPPGSPLARDRGRGTSLSLRPWVSLSTHRLAHMLDSLARVSRRGGWTTDRTRRPGEPPTARRQPGDRAARETRLSTESRDDPVRHGGRGHGPPHPRLGREAVRNTPRARSAPRGEPYWLPGPRPPLPQPAAASYPGGSASSPPGGRAARREAQAKATPERPPPPRTIRMRATAPAGGLTPPVALRGSTRFSPERFHALLNSLSKVLFNFPSRYLFAIGLVVVFSLRWSLPPALGCNLKQPDSPGSPGQAAAVPTGLAPSPGHGPFRGDLRTANEPAHG
jgi:hypothetical protein